MELTNIEPIFSQEGILLPANKQYKLTATYDNNTTQPQDSMAVQGIFFEDNRFVKPFWPPSQAAELVQKDRKFDPEAPKSNNDIKGGVYCGVKPAPTAVDQT